MHIASERRTARALWALIFLMAAQFGLLTTSASAASNELVHGRGTATAESFPVPGFLSWPAVGIDRTTESGGYWVVDTRGLVRAFNGAPFFGDARSLPLNSPIVDMAGNSKGTGYWLLGKDGAVYSYGSAAYSGAATALAGEAVAITDNGVGNGYWIALADGRVSHHGAAPDLPDAFGSAPARIVGMAATGTNAGYWLLAENGEVLPFGDAVDYGDGIGQASSFTAIAARPDGGGYWLVARDGTIVSRGSAAAFNAVSSEHPAIGAASTKTGDGLWVATSGSYDPGAIQGVVKNLAGKALAGICVRTQGPGWYSPAVTSVTGFYRLPNLFPGGYKVQFDDCTNQAYYRQWFGGAATDSDSPAVTVQSGQTTFKVNAAMGLGGFISGGVRDDAGNRPATVCVNADDPSSGWRDYGNVSVTGSYRVGPMKPGAYLVTFSDCGMGDKLSQTWPAADYRSLGNPVKVVAGGHVKGISGILRTPGAITGVVTDAEGAPLSGICVDAGPPGEVNRSGETNSFSGDITSVTGFYRLSGLRTDGYAVHYRDCSNKGVAEEWHHNALTAAKAELVNVVNGQTTEGVNEALAPGAAISGHVSGGNPCATVRAWRNGEVITGLDDQAPIATAATSVTGFYRIAGLRAGTYKVSFTSCSPTVGTKWWKQSETRAGGTAIALDPGEEVGNVFVDFGGGGSISGVVRDPDGAVRSGACVQAKDPSGLTWGASTSVTGYYRITGLSNQAYKVRFDPCGSGPGAPEWFDNKANKVASTPVAVANWADTPNINAQFELGATISGKVTNPVRWAEAACVNVFDNGGHLVRQGHASHTGFYKITGLHGGQYKVRAFDCEPGVLAPEWWNDSPDLAGADSITLGAGKTATADFELAYQPPKFPENVTVQENTVGPAEVAISWDVPLNTGTSPITQYEITAWTGGFPVKTFIAPADATSYVTSDLTYHTAYRFRVAARNAGGLGRQSELSDVVVFGPG